VATQIATFTADGFSSLEINALSSPAGDTFKIGQFSTSVAQLGNPVDFSVPLTVTDGDGDTASGAINVLLMPGSGATQNHSADLVGDPHTYTATASAPNIIGSGFGDVLNGDGGNNVLYGGAGVDTLNGNAGNDTRIGNADGDTLNGGNGDDTFVLQVKSTGHDTIGDFLVSGTDQIIVDIGGGLTIANPGAIDASNFHTGDETNSATWNGGTGTGNEFVWNAGTHELWYSANGTGTDKIDLAHVTTGIPSATNVHTI